MRVAEKLDWKGLKKSFGNVILYLFTYLITYSIQHSPSWEANRFAASQKVPRILWNPKVHYRIY
jgi:hypothetical protein